MIKLEHPIRGDDTRHWGPPFVGEESAYFLSVNRNKESLTLDFKRLEGKRILDALLARADCLVENFRPGTLEAVGLGGATLLAGYPRSDRTARFPGLATPDRGGMSLATMP